MQDLLLIHILTCGQLHSKTSNAGAAFLYTAHDDTIQPPLPPWVDTAAVWSLIYANETAWQEGATARAPNQYITARPVSSVEAMQALARCNHNQPLPQPKPTTGPHKYVPARHRRSHRRPTRPTRSTSALVPLN